MLAKTGIATLEQVASSFPSIERLEKGPVAIIECFQKIPCNPCATACKKGAIRPFTDINNLPDINHDECNGCSLCVFKCPGLAIMVVDYTHSESHASIKIPYEFLPLPNIGEEVKALDRGGEEIGMCKVIGLLNNKMVDKTPVITVEVHKDILKTFRNIKVVR